MASLARSVAARWRRITRALEMGRSAPRAVMRRATARHRMPRTVANDLKGPPQHGYGREARWEPPVPTFTYMNRYVLTTEDRVVHSAQMSRDERATFSSPILPLRLSLLITLWGRTARVGLAEAV